ncbi:MAG: hypothetical protein HY275_06130 [Gemmatimonadetes bacterium]|nr:hypothetical protein [Gemmatimonadota bacterium]
MHDLMQAWIDWRPSKDGLFLEADRPAVGSIDAAMLDWTQYHRDEAFGEASDTRLHLRLTPQPFFGNPETARIVVLTLNPGLGPDDYFAEFEYTKCRDVLRANLAGHRNGFMWLDPTHSWHGGFEYWYRRFRETIRAFAERTGLPMMEARKWWQANVACVELLPYHSESFRMSQRQLDAFASSQLARRFAREVLEPRAATGECLMVMARAVRQWGYDRDRLPKGFIATEGGEARSGYLSPNTSVGEPMLEVALRHFGGARPRS